MPIECGENITTVSDSVFSEIDRLVMSSAYAAQNSLGSLCEERVYENDVAARLRAEGVTKVLTQVPVTVALKDFQKVYRLDLIVNDVVYELKTAEVLCPAHDAQALHYAALLDVDRVKLINFASPSVQGKLLRSPFARIDRRAVTIDRTRWQPLSQQCATLAADMEACLSDWGGFLAPRLYEAALVVFQGGESVRVRRLPVTRLGLPLGHHQVNLIADDVAFSVTALSKGGAAHETQLRCLLEVLPLRGWQWINIHHTEMRLVTISCQGKGMGA